MPWHENMALMTVLGAAGGGLLTAIVSVIIWYRSRKSKRLDCALGDPISLLSVRDEIIEKLEVKYDGKPVSTAYLFPVEIANTGQLAIEEQPVLIQLSDGARIVDIDIETEPSLGFGEIKEVSRNGNTIGLTIALMNPGDRVRLELLSIDNNSETIEVGLKKADVEVRILTRKSLEDALSVFSNDFPLTGLAVLSTLPLFGSLARSFMTISLAKRMDSLSAKGSGRRTK